MAKKYFKKMVYVVMETRGSVPAMAEALKKGATVDDTKYVSLFPSSPRCQVDVLWVVPFPLTFLSLLLHFRVYM